MKELKITPGHTIYYHWKAVLVTALVNELLLGILGILDLVTLIANPIFVFFFMWLNEKITVEGIFKTDE